MKINERGEGRLNLDVYCAQVGRNIFVVWTKTSIGHYLDVPIWTSDIRRVMDVTNTSILDSKKNSAHMLKATRIMEDHFIDI